MYKFIAAAIVSGTALWSSTSYADVGLGLRGGTLGFGADFSVGLTQSLSARVAYNYLNYSRTVDDTDATYDGTLKIGSPSAYLDWHPGGHGFRISLGAVASGPKLDVVGTPTGSGTYDIGGTVYTTAQIGSIEGEIKIGNSLAPYVGLGYGHIVSERHRITFLFDLGAIYGGTPQVNLTAKCNPSLSTNACNTLQTQLQTDVAREIRDLEENASEVKWYPVINLGLGIRF